MLLLLLLFMMSLENLVPSNFKFKVFTVTHSMLNMFRFFYFQLIKMSKLILGKRLFRNLMKATFYGHFVAGENEEEIAPVIARLNSFGVKAIFDYSAEEDVSEEQATESEYKAITPQNTDETNQSTVPMSTIELRKFKPDKEFADRRKFTPVARTYFYQNEASCEKNMETFLRCIEAVAGVTDHTGFAAIKLTALGRPQILLQLSEVIVRSRMLFREVTGHDKMALSGVTPEEFQDRYKRRFDIKSTDGEVNKWINNMDFDQRGLMNLFSWNGLIDMNMLVSDLFKVPNLKTGRMETILTALTSEEDEMFRNMMRRIHTIAKLAKDTDVRVMIDAEQTYFQPAINRITIEMMRKYNQEKAIIFNTYQCYLKVRNNFFCLSLHLPL